MSGLKIGIIGTDGGAKSGHASAICRLIEEEWRDAEIAGIFGEDEECTRELFEACNIGRIVQSPEELLNIADAVMVLNRDGRKHFKYAMPFIKKGMPVFIDKPVTCSYDEAAELAEAAKKYGGVLMGGSYMKLAPELAELKKEAEEANGLLSGYFSFPIFLNSEHGGIHFYSHHLIEEMTAVFGRNVREISARVSSGKLIATAYYDDFPVIMNYAVAYPAFYAGIYANDRHIMRQVSADGLDAKQLDRFIRAAKSGTGADELTYAVKISDALEKAINTGKTVVI